MLNHREISDKSDLSKAVRRKPVPSQEVTAMPLLDKVESVELFPEGWPTSPGVVKVSIYTVIWSLIVDLSLLVCSVSFFAFAWIVISYDGLLTQNSPHAKERLLSASKYGPTVFPILFAAVMGRATHAIMIWRLEAGERISILDTLAGSTSLTSTITSLFRLRAIGGMGVILVTVWSLSPIGGQASFRQLSVGTRIDPEPYLFNYTTFTGDLKDYYGSNRDAMWAVVNGLFTAALVGPYHTKTSALDLWGNIKIPRIEYFEDNDEVLCDKDGWYSTGITTNLGSDPMLYSSLTGIPMAGFNDTNFIDYKWTIHTSYFNLSDCHPLDPEYGRRPPNTSYVVNYPNDNGGLIYWASYLNTSYGGYHSSRTNVSYHNGSVEAFRFGYSSQLGSIPPGECRIQTVYVEAEVSCGDASSCLISRIRRSRLSHPQVNITQFDFETIDHWNWDYFARAFVGAFTSRPDFENAMDFYIQGSNDPVAITYANFSDLLPAQDYVTVIRLGQLINTFWSITVGPQLINGGIEGQDARNTSYLSYSIVDGGASRWLGDVGIWKTQGTRSRRVEIFQAHVVWVVTLCITSTILIIASLVPPIMRHFLTKGPDIMMNISSLTMREYKNDALLSSGTFLQASDRSRLLGDCKVRFGDIDEEGDVGRLAIAKMSEEDEIKIGRIRKGRVYE